MDLFAFPAQRLDMLQQPENPAPPPLRYSLDVSLGNRIETAVAITRIRHAVSSIGRNDAREDGEPCIPRDILQSSHARVRVVHDIGAELPFGGRHGADVRHGNHIRVEQNRAVKVEPAQGFELGRFVAVPQVAESLDFMHPVSGVRE